MLKVAVTLLLCLASAGSAAENASPWPRFRGPNGSGVAEGQQPPIHVGPEENVLWKVQTPPGLSSPIVLDDLLVMTGFDGGKLWTIAYRRSDGSEAWRAEAPAERLESYHAGDGSPAASTPATDGERIVSYFGSCGLFCYDKAGRELWSYPLPTAATLGNFGTGTSPLIEEGVVLLLRDGPSDSQLIALDVKSGAVKWRQPRTSRGGFSTPVIWETAAGKQVAAPGHGRLIGYDLQTGESRWFVEGMPTSCCASPVIANGDLYFAAWSPGAAGDADFKLPAFQLVLLADGDANGTLSRDELAKSPLKDFFDVIDASQDGSITCDEWDAAGALMAAAKNSAFALQPGGSGDITATHVRWRHDGGLPYVPSAIVYDGQQAMVKDGGIVTVNDVASGEELFQKRAVASGGYYASPVAANGSIYFTSLTDGTITVLKAGESSPVVLAKNSPLGERTSATPAIADDTLYVRTAGHLYAFREHPGGKR